VEVRSGHRYCDLSAGWSNTALLQCFTWIPPLFLSWGEAYLPSLPAHSADLTLWIFGRYRQDRVFAHNPQTIDALKNYIVTFEQRSGDFPMRWWTGSSQILNVQVATVIQCQGVWIKHRVVLASWWCTRKNLHHTKTYMSVRQTYEKKLKSIPFTTKWYFIKIG